MIVVTGATGHLGRGVIDALLRRRAANDIVASVRDPERAADLSSRGIEVRPGDFADVAALASAFAGATQVLVVSVNQIGDAGRRLHRNAIEAAYKAGTKRVLYTSHMGTHATSPLNDHHAAEVVLADTGMAFTSLRHGFYAESAFHLVGDGFETGEIRVPEDGPVSWTARADLAETDAAVLAEEGRLDGVTAPLTAPEAFTMADLAAMASETTGRNIRRVVVPDDAWLQAKIDAGAPPFMAGLLLEMFRAARRGEFSATDPTLASLIGRRPKTMRDMLVEKLGPG